MFWFSPTFQVVPAMKLERPTLKTDSDKLNLNFGSQEIRDYQLFSCWNFIPLNRGRHLQVPRRLPQFCSNQQISLILGEREWLSFLHLLERYTSSLVSLWIRPLPKSDITSSLFAASCPILTWGRLTHCFSWLLRARKHVPCWQCVSGHCWLPLSWKGREGRGHILPTLLVAAGCSIEETISEQNSGDLC